MTQNLTYRFFISSVIRGLEKEREIVERVISREHNAKMSEKFVGNNPSKQMIQEELAKCDVYIGIFDTIWGEIPITDNPEKLSITALEYYEAERLKLPQFVIVSRNMNKEKELTTFLNKIGVFENGQNWNRYQDHIELAEIVTAFLPNLVQQISRKSVKVNHVIPPRNNFVQPIELQILEILYQPEETIRKIFEANKGNSGGDFANIKIFEGINNLVIKIPNDEFSLALKKLFDDGIIFFDWIPQGNNPINMIHVGPRDSFHNDEFETGINQMVEQTKKLITDHGWRLIGDTFSKN